MVDSFRFVPLKESGLPSPLPFLLPIGQKVNLSLLGPCEPRQQPRKNRATRQKQPATGLFMYELFYEGQINFLVQASFIWHLCLRS